jgi:hypothetical protein
MLHPNQIAASADARYEAGRQCVQLQDFQNAHAQFLQASFLYALLLQQPGPAPSASLYRRIGECGIQLSCVLRSISDARWREPLWDAKPYLEFACRTAPFDPANQFAWNFAATMWAEPDAHFAVPQQPTVTVSAQAPKPELDADGFSHTRAKTLLGLADVAYSPTKIPHDAVKIATPTGGVVGFIHQTKQDVVISIRGSVIPSRNLSVNEWLHAVRDWFGVNLNYRQTPGFGGRVHSGFLKALDEAWPSIRSHVNRNSLGNRNLWLTGHSLGGAIAKLAGQRLFEENCPPSGIYTFGAPKVGDEAFAIAFQPPLFRVENRHEIVPFLPISKWLSEMMSEFLKEVELTSLSGFLTNEDFRAVGVCKWIKTDGTIVNPSFIDEFQRWFGVLGNMKRWVGDHMVDAFSWASR